MGENDAYRDAAALLRACMLAMESPEQDDETADVVVRHLADPAGTAEIIACWFADHCRASASGFDDLRAQLAAWQAVWDQEKTGG